MIKKKDITFTMLHPEDRLKKAMESGIEIISYPQSIEIIGAAPIVRSVAYIDRNEIARYKVDAIAMIKEDIKTSIIRSIYSNVYDRRIEFYKIKEFAMIHCPHISQNQLDELFKLNDVI